MMSDLLDGIVEPDVPGTSLAIIEVANFSLTYEPGGIQKAVENIKAEARREAAALDSTTVKGRAAIVRLGSKVASSKVAMDEGGKKLNEDANQKINRVNADRRFMREEMDALKIEVLAPVELYKKTLAEREAANNDAITAMEAMLDGIADLSSIDIRQRAETIPTFDYAPEFQIKAAKVRASVVAQLTVAYQTAKAREDAIEGFRIANHHRNLAKVTESADFGDSWSGDIRIDDIINRIAWLNGWKDYDWAEFAAQGVEAITMSIAKLNGLRGEIETREAAERVAREEQIAREAAAEATRVAEQKAAQETEMARQAAQASLLAEQEAAAERERLAKEELARVEAERLAGIERERVAAEKAEADRIEAHEKALADMDEKTYVEPGSSSDTIRATMQRYVVWPVHHRDWQEFGEQHKADYTAGIAHLEACLKTATETEEKQRIAAHESAFADFTFIVGSVAGEPSSTDVIQSIASLQRLHANRDWEEFTDRATKERAATMMTFQTKLASAQVREKKAADELAEARRLQIVKDEQDRVARKTEQQRKADALRAANTENQRRVNREAMEDIMTKIEWPGGVAEALARMIVTAVAEGEIRHVGVTY